MTQFDQQRMIETVLYILQRTGGLDTYHIFKVLYGERLHLAKWGESLVPDTFRAFKHGPVPVNLYFAEQKQSHKPEADKILLDAFGNDIVPAGDDAGYIYLHGRTPDMEYLSLADIDTLNEVIDQYAFMPYVQLEKMAEEGGATKEMLDYIREQEELEKAFT